MFSSPSFFVDSRLERCAIRATYYSLFSYLESLGCLRQASLSVQLKGVTVEQAGRQARYLARQSSTFLFHSRREKNVEKKKNIKRFQVGWLAASCSAQFKPSSFCMQKQQLLPCVQLQFIDGPAGVGHFLIEWIKM